MTKQGKILIADDDDVFLRTTAAVLEQAGHVCSCVENASAVMELVTSQQFDLLIVDIQIPGNAQLDMIQGLQNSFPQIPIILVTGYPSLDTALLAIRLRVLAYLVKPFEVDLLLSEVQHALVHAEMQRRMLALQNRWRTWAEELLASAATLQPKTATNILTLETTLNMTLYNLTQCITEVQELRQAIGKSAAQTSFASAPVLTRLDVPNTRILQAKSPVTLEPPSPKENKRTDPLDNLRAELLQLTRREREVLHLLLTNHKPQSISKKLFISLHTVRNHLRSIFEKLAVHSQTELLTRFGRYMAYADLRDVV